MTKDDREFFEDIGMYSVEDIHYEITENDIKTLFNLNIGMILCYDIKNEKSSIIFPQQFEMSKEQLIPIGIIINQFENKSVDILPLNFLIDKPLSIPLSYIRKTKEQLSFFIYDMFKKYINLYKKQLNIECLKNIPIRMIGIKHFETIYKNIDIIKSSLTTVIGEEKAEKFIEKFLQSYIYCLYDKKLYVCNIKDNEVNIDSPTIYNNGEFLIVLNYDYIEEEIIN